MIIAEPSESFGKDAYYFSHDSNARNDQKCLKLRRVLGMEGYGIFWVLVEMLRDATEFKLPLDSVPDIAYETRVSEEKILAVINQFDLFTVEDGKFFSLRLIRSMELMQAKSEKYRKNALKRWNNATAMQLHSNGNALKERKGKETKGNESYKSGKEAYDNITSDTLFLERIHILITNTGFRYCTLDQAKQIISRFIMVESAKPEFNLRDQSEVKSHLIAWINKNAKQLHEYAS